MRQFSTGTEAAERVADVLLSFTHADGPLGVSHIARDLGLSKAVVHRILQSLVSRSLIQHLPETRAYQLGTAAAGLGTRSFRQFDLRSAARVPLIELRDRTGETTTLSLLVGDKRTYVDQFESPREVKMTVELGRMHPLHAGASSRAILAHLPDAFVQRVAAGPLAALTPYTLTSPQRLRDNLTVVRAKGYARSVGERQIDAASLSAPVFGPGGDVIGSVSVCGPASRFTDSEMDDIVPQLLEASRAISST